MKNHITVKSSLFTLILALIAISTVAIAAVMDKPTETPTTYYYNGPSADYKDHVMDPSNWDISKKVDVACNGKSEIPCTIAVPDGKTLSDYLQELGSPDVVSQNASSYRE